MKKTLLWRPEILSEQQVFCWKSRTPYCGVSQQTNLQAAISEFCTYYLLCDYALNHFIVVKYWSLSWNEIISCGPSSEELGRLGLSRGDLSRLIVTSVYSHSVVTPHARQSKARLRGMFWMNSLTGPRWTGTCLRSAATHSRFCPLSQSYDQAHLAKWSGMEELSLCQTQKIHTFFLASVFHILSHLLVCHPDIDVFCGNSLKTSCLIYLFFFQQSNISQTTYL